LRFQYQKEDKEKIPRNRRLLIPRSDNENGRGEEGGRKGKWRRQGNVVVEEICRLTQRGFRKSLSTLLTRRNKHCSTGGA
jgi:hypothetical protein